MASNVRAEPHSGKNVNTPAGSAAAPKTDRVGWNASYLTIAFTVQKVLALAYFLFATRAVGRDAIGQYTTALIITGLFGYFIDIAFSQVLIREIAKHREKTNAYLNAALALKFLTSLLIYAAVMSYVVLFRYEPDVRNLVAIAGLVMVLDSFTLTLYAVFRGHQNLLYEAIGTVVNKVLVIAVGLGGLRFGFGVRWLVTAVLVGSAFNFLYAAVLLIRKVQWRPRPQWDGDTLLFLAKIALPFAIGGVFITILGYQDQLLLGNPALAGPKWASYAAYYGTAYKLAFSLQFIPAAVVAAIFPAMSYYYLANKPKLAQTFERGMKYLLIIGMPLALGIVALAREVIITAYTPVFMASVTPLRLLIISLLFVFLNYPVGYLLNAADRQVRNTVNVGIVMVFNLILNLFLIPIYTFVGAAIASLLSSALLFFLGLSVTRSIMQYDARKLFMVFIQTLVGASSMAVGVFVLKEELPLIALTLMGALWYAALLLLMGTLKISDMSRVYRVLLKRTA